MSNFNSSGKRTAAALAVLLMAGLSCSTVLAQTYPVKPVKLIVPYAPGGPTDIMGRVIAKNVSETIGGQMVVEIAQRGKNRGPNVAEWKIMAGHAVQ